MPNSAMRSGSSRYDRSPCLKIWMWPGQFIGLMAKTRSSSVSSPADFAMNMFSRNQPQWPEVSHSDLSSSCGALTSLIVALQAAAHVADDLLEDGPAVGVPEHRARAFLLEVEQVHLAAELAVVALLGLFDAACR